MSGWKVKIERPEEIYSSPEDFYTEEEIEKYASSSSMKRAQERNTIRILELLNSSPPAKVLDLGCGVGYSTMLLKELGYEVTGIDMLSGMVKVAKKKGLDVIRGDFRHLKKYFNKDSFDYVVSTSAIQWVKKLGDKKMMAEGIYYVLKSGGKVGIHFYPKSEKEMEEMGTVFKSVGFKGNIVIDNENSPRKRNIYIILSKVP